MSETVLMERHPGWRRLVLNRPDRLNAFDAAMQAALAAALDEAEQDRSCRAVVLAGAGRAFSAGQDLDAVRGETDLGRVLEEGWNPLIRRLARLGVPTVAAVHGIAAGAGAALALACDIVLAARSARFLMAFARIGLVPDSGASWHLPRLIGPARARAVAGGDARRHAAAIGHGTAAWADGSAHRACPAAGARRARHPAVRPYDDVRPAHRGRARVAIGRGGGAVASLRAGGRF